MGLRMKNTQRPPVQFTSDEIQQLEEQFNSVDVDRKGYITIKDLRALFKVSYSSLVYVCQG